MLETVEAELTEMKLTLQNKDAKLADKTKECHLMEVRNRLLLNTFNIPSLV